VVLFRSRYRSSEIDFDKIARRYGVEYSCDLGCVFLDHRPACHRQYHNRDLAVCEILLVFQALIGGEKTLQTFLDQQAAANRRSEYYSSPSRKLS
jgi:hypothetical protein